MAQTDRSGLFPEVLPVCNALRMAARRVPTSWSGCTGPRHRNDTSCMFETLLIVCSTRQLGHNATSVLCLFGREPSFLLHAPSYMRDAICPLERLGPTPARTTGEWNAESIDDAAILGG